MKHFKKLTQSKGINKSCRICKFVNKNFQKIRNMYGSFVINFIFPYHH